MRSTAEMGHMIIAESILRQHEGLCLKPYLCTSGKLTVGYGRNLDDKGLNHDEALFLLSNDILDSDADLENFAYWSDLNDNQKAALIDLHFCVGPAGYREFEKMNAALLEGDYDEAAAQIIDSKFASQTGDRAQDLADMITMGE